MKYINENDLILALSKETLIQLTNTDPEHHQIDHKVTEEICKKVSSEIDSYLAVKKKMPLPFVPDVIKEKCLSLAIYYLHRRGENLIPEHIKDDYDRTIKYLDKFVEGKIKIPELPDIEDPAITGQKLWVLSTTTGKQPVFSDDALSKF